jgi:hypothetical protein
MALTAVLRDLNKLNTFVRVGQCRSFTKAAAELRTTPSVISKRMKELEESLGFSLLNRSTHGLVFFAPSRIGRRCRAVPHPSTRNLVGHDTNEASTPGRRLLDGSGFASGICR